MDRPPPYFPQNSLNPKDENRYRKFKLLMAALAAILVLAVVGAGVGVYYLVSWMLG